MTPKLVPDRRIWVKIRVAQGEQTAINETSQQRVEWANSVATAYASHPDVQAIILGGSTARGMATEHSDIDLGLFWTQITSQKERSDLMRRAGGKLNRCVENHQRCGAGNPRRQGCIEIIELKPGFVIPRLRLDLEHETVAGTETVLLDVLDKHDPSLEKQALLSVIQDGIALYGHEMIGRWRERSKCYPDKVASKMVAQNILGIGNSLLIQVHWAKTKDWFCLYEGFLAIGRRLLLSLMGLNRVWAFTNNPDFKGLKPFVDGLGLKPHDLVNQLGQLLQSNAFTCIRGFVGLSEAVLELVEAHMPEVDTLREREVLGKVKHETTRCA